MSSFTQYLKDTRAELNHVAWPTRTQTIVYTILVAAISIGISLYLGLFDAIFTGALTRAVNAISPTPITQNTASTTPISTSTTTAVPAVDINNLLPKPTR